jgi:hypothetical protein
MLGKGDKFRNTHSGKTAEIVDVLQTETRYGDPETAYIMSDDRKRSLTAGEVRANYRRITEMQTENA